MRYRIFIGILAVLGLMSNLAIPPIAALTYGAGAYGTCQYNTCSISLSTSGTVATNITPGSSPTCTVASDTLTVTTSSTTGYTLQLVDVDTSRQLTGGTTGSTIPGLTATPASPTVLSPNTWGFRIDAGAFGTGPTTAMNNSAIPSLTFAGIPITTPVAIASSGQPATPDTLHVWYGVCADNSTPADTYTDVVRYTVVVN